MSFHYIGDGTVYTGSFALVHKNLFIKYKFDKYSIAYDKFYAQKGILKKVFIQKVVLKNIIKSFHKNVVMYVDNLKSMYNEYDLLTLEEAQAIIDQSVYVPPNCTPPIDPPEPLPSTFAPNSVHYSRNAAIKGTLEKVVILRSLPQQPQIYVSTLQGMYNEDDLISLAEAQDLIENSPPVPPYCPVPVEPPLPLPATYPPNSILFSLNDSVKGILTKIVILRSLPQSPYVYEDTLHSLWNEAELIPETEAKANALAYWETRKTAIEELLNNLI